MTIRMSRRGLTVGAGCFLAAGVGSSTAAQRLPSEILVAANSIGSAVSFLDPESGDVELVDVGFAPWGITSSDEVSAFVSTAEGVARVALGERRLDAMWPYRTSIPELTVGEYRPGGMGIAISPNGAFVYVAVYVTTGPSVVEVMRTDTGVVEEVVEVGVRPFQVLVSEDGQFVYSIDHDSFSVTVIDSESGDTNVIPVSPLGTSGFDKPHYAALDGDGNLILPYQGVQTIRLDPVSGSFEAVESSANTHQHGIARIGESERYVLAGTGPAGSAGGGPNVAIVDMNAGTETLWETARPHEDVVMSRDHRYAYLSGGYSFQNQGWDGISKIDLETGETREYPVPDRPLGMLLVQHNEA